MENKFIYDESLGSEVEAVATITIGESKYLMPIEDYEKAKEEGRTRPIIYGEKLIFVDDETAEDLKVLEEWLKNNKQPNADDYKL